MDYSPLLAIFTGIFEFVAALFVFSSPGRKRILYPTATLLLLLAGYQFSEVAVCFNPSQRLFTRIAYFDITWLPPLGIWLCLQLITHRKKWMSIFPLFYFTSGVVFAVWIMVDPNCVTQSICETVIARFITTNPFDILYALYYQSGLLVLIFGSALAMAYEEDSIFRKHLANLQVGVLGFVLPSLLVRLLVSDSNGILPSVMCHFALILAISLFILVLRERRTA